LSRAVKARNLAKFAKEHMGADFLIKGGWLDYGVKLLDKSNKVERLAGTGNY
jgi:hypothetical protein